jgi:hypothetical protein
LHWVIWFSPQLNHLNVLLNYVIFVFFLFFFISFLQPNANVVAISSCYYASQAVGVSEADATAAVVLSKLKEFHKKLVDTLTNRDTLPNEVIS